MVAISFVFFLKKRLEANKIDVFKGRFVGRLKPDYYAVRVKNIIRSDFHASSIA